jgi:hypothetical protein
MVVTTKGGGVECRAEGGVEGGVEGGWKKEGENNPNAFSKKKKNKLK